MTDWRKVRVRDIAATSKNALVGGPFGSNLVSKDYVETGVPVIRGQNMGHRWVSGDFVFVSEEKAKSLEANLARSGDIVFTQRGTLGQVSLVPSVEYGRYLLSQSQMKLTIDNSLADPLFYYYVFSGPEQQEYFRKNAIQTGVPHTNLGILRETPIPLPPLSEQRAIAHILGTLDDKIELNRRMNETLEAMARALFKSWFVDFDPVHAKATGRDTGLPPHIADLFPDSFENSELGEIPTGWTVSRLGDLLELAYGKPLPADERKAGRVPVYGSNGQIGWHDTALVEGPGIVVGRKGNPGTVIWANTSFFPIDTTFYVVSKGMGNNLSFLFHALCRQGLVSLGADSAVPGLNRNMAYMNLQLVPPASVQACFEIALRPSYSLIQMTNSNSGLLVQMRDALLPKLVSGELRLSD